MERGGGGAKARRGSISVAIRDRGTTPETAPPRPKTGCFFFQTGSEAPSWDSPSRGGAQANQCLPIRSTRGALSHYPDTIQSEHRAAVPWTARGLTPPCCASENTDAAFLGPVSRPTAVTRLSPRSWTLAATTGAPGTTSPPRCTLGDRLSSHHPRLTRSRRPKIDETRAPRLHGSCEPGENERGNNGDGGGPAGNRCCRRRETAMLSPVGQ